MGEKHNRSVLKSLIWRIAGILILGAVTYAYTRHWIQTSLITFIHHGTFLFVFYAHERFYQHVNYTGLKRKIIKAITYETILGNFILGIITLIITGNVQQMTYITLTYIGIKHLCYVFNEFLWDKISWGIKNEISDSTK